MDYCWFMGENRMMNYENVNMRAILYQKLARDLARLATMQIWKIQQC